VPLLAIGLILPQAPANAAPPTTATAATPQTTHKVTLVTGDVVTVTTLANGQQTAEVDRPDDAVGGVRIQEIKGDLYVVPDEAAGLLGAGTLDRRLFDVTDLIEMCYDGVLSSQVPTIATYPKSAARSAAEPAAPRGSKLVRRLAGIRGSALTTDKRQARTFWSTLAPRGAAKLGAGVAKLWLDGRVRVNLKESVPQIGAPEAWAAGYDGHGVTVAVLDTGVDATHPDLAGQIDETESFVPGESVADINGHGTHVASTIAGTGAASGGDYKGVAPGADLIVGKVLGGTDGYGADSWVMAGMQWAAESGADIVSMSLGDDSVVSDGSDPMSQLVDALSAQYGTLFVIASGNAGPETIGPPGAAASALTVGAVDKQDALAYFSSTGPVTGAGAIKPDIVAPGVDITAARSQEAADGGEGMYQTMSGTSMATPHVSGAAAILAQRHPEWTGAQLKEALMSSAKGLADYYTPYEVGAGRVDVAAAVRATVRATGSAFLGNYPWPHTDEAPITRTVTFTNDGTAAITLDLTVTGPFAVSAPSVTVPAGGTADVAVTGDPAAAAYGRNTAVLVGTVAATGAPATRTALALIKEEERYDLTLSLVGRDGQPASGTVVLNREGDWWPSTYAVDGEATLRLPPGTYTAETALDVPGEKGDRLGFAVLVAPEVTLSTGPARVVLDASKARLLDTAAPQRSEVRQRKIDFRVAYAGGSDFRLTYQVPIKYDDLYLSPTDPVTSGSFDAATRWRLGEPMLTVKALGLVDFPTTVQPGSTFAAGSDRLVAVYAGKGAPADYAGVKAKGRAVVVTASDEVSAADRAAAAVAAGARALLVVNDGPGVLNEYVGEVGIPVATVHRDAGKALVTLAKSGAFTLTTTRVPYATYVYDLARDYSGQVPDRSLAYQPGKNDLARIDATYYAQHDGEGSGYRYDMTFSPSFGFAEREWYAGTRTEWVSPDMVWHENHSQNGWEDRAFLNSYAKGSRTSLRWFAPAVHPSFGEGYSVRNARYGDYLTLNVQSWTPSGELLDHGGTLDWGSVPETVRLYQGDTLVAENTMWSDLQYVEVPAGTLPYRLVHDASRPADPWRLSTRAHTEWAFVSGTTPTDAAAQPVALLELNYLLDTDLRGDVPAGATRTITVTAGPQGGGGPAVGKVTSVTLDVSYDDGKSWQQVTLQRGADGGWSGALKLAGKRGGFVSVRASARTDAGWSVSQEVIRAYGLR
jgi:subtilisin family serine protease